MSQNEKTFFLLIRGAFDLNASKDKKQGASADGNMPESC